MTLVVFKMVEVAWNFFARECLDHAPDFLAVYFRVNRGCKVAFLPAERSPTPGLDKLHPHFVIEGGIALIESFGFVPLTYQCFTLLIPPGFGAWSRKS